MDSDLLGSDDLFGGHPRGDRRKPPTDASGNYEFDGLIAARYQMTVTADQFQTYQQDLDLTFRGTWYTVDVTYARQ